MLTFKNPSCTIVYMKRYEQIPHTADLAARIYGQDMTELYRNAAYAMFDMMADLDGVTGVETVKVKAKAPDNESLIIAWLNEVLYLAYERELVFCDFDVKVLAETRVEAEVKGQGLKVKEGVMHTEIKAATYHDLEIKKREHGYEVTIVFDV